MLKNELLPLRELLFNEGCTTAVTYSTTELREHIQLIQEAWLNEIFSDLPKSSLKRYLQFHLEGIAKISDALHGFPAQEAGGAQRELLSLIDHLNDFYFELLNWDSNAPAAYHRRHIAGLAPLMDSVRVHLNWPAIPELLKNSIQSWFNEISDFSSHAKYTYRSLTYLDDVVRKLNGLDWESEGISEALVTLLYQANFNHLSFFAYLQMDIKLNLARISGQSNPANGYRTMDAYYSSIPLKRNCIYDDAWPSIKAMVSGWLQELIKCSGTVSQEENVPERQFTGKLGLNISVADIACLIRLLYEENVFGTENLRSIFKFYAENYQSKRQPAISWESLSKEYYSLTFHNTSGMQKILQRMIDKLNRGFFPA